MTCQFGELDSSPISWSFRVHKLRSSLMLGWINLEFSKPEKNLFGAKYSRMDQVKFVKDSL